MPCLVDMNDQVLPLNDWQVEDRGDLDPPGDPQAVGGGCVAEQADNMAGIQDRVRIQIVI